MNAIEIHAGMPLKQIVARLLQLADHRTPAAVEGYVKPVVPVPVHEWALLREAAARLDRMGADLDSLRRATYARDMAKHADWAVIDQRGTIIWAGSFGFKQAEWELQQRQKVDPKGTRLWTVRPVTIGGLRVAEDQIEGIANA